MVIFAKRSVLKKMRKIILTVFAVLAAAALLFGCQKAEADASGAEQSGEPSVSESAAQSSESEPEQSQSEKEKLLPPVEGPDEDGKFPAISKDAYEKYIFNSDPVSGQTERERERRPKQRKRTGTKRTGGKIASGYCPAGRKRKICADRYRGMVFRL